MPEQGQREDTNKGHGVQSGGNHCSWCQESQRAVQQKQLLWVAESHHMLCFHFLPPPIPGPGSFDGRVVTAEKIKEVDPGKEGVSY